MKIIGETLEIPYRAIHWGRVWMLDDETMDRIWRPFLLSWYHPHSEWYGDMNDRDIRSRDWKQRMIRLYKLCGCWWDATAMTGRGVFRRLVHRRHLYI